MSFSSENNMVISSVYSPSVVNNLASFHNYFLKNDYLNGDFYFSETDCFFDINKSFFSIDMESKNNVGSNKPLIIEGFYVSDINKEIIEHPQKVSHVSFEPFTCDKNVSIGHNTLKINSNHERHSWVIHAFRYSQLSLNIFSFLYHSDFPLEVGYPKYLPYLSFNCCSYLQYSYRTSYREFNDAVILSDVDFSDIQFLFSSYFYSDINLHSGDFYRV